MANPYPRNPRTLSKRRQQQLADSLARFGDLSGVVHNLTDNTIVGGNQRVFAVFKRLPTPEIVSRIDPPDEQGTVAHGFIIHNDKRYSYRQVRWDEAMAREANIRANMGAGEWDWSELAAYEPSELSNWGFDDERLNEWNHDALNLREMDTADNVVEDEAAAEIERADKYDLVLSFESEQERVEGKRSLLALGFYPRYKQI